MTPRAEFCVLTLASGIHMRVVGPVLLRCLSVFILIVLSMWAYSGAAWAQKQGRADIAVRPSAESEEVKRLKLRVEQLEEQLVDLQVTVATLESLMRRGGGGAALSRSAPQPPAASPGGFSGGLGDDGRLQSMETQISALSQQVEQLTQQLNRGSAGRGANVDGSLAANNQAVQPGDYGLRDQNRPQQAGPSGPGFGDLTVTPGNQAQPQSYSRTAPQGGGANDLAPQPANYDSRRPRAIYDEAYKYLLVQNYGAAEQAFNKFLQLHPNDQLSGNAQYWLGESYYVRGQYKNAAGAFLKGYKVYAKSQKAPDSLLKLAMSLKRLGQKDAACDTFGELGTRFPRAPSHIKQRARSERRRSGC